MVRMIEKEVFVSVISSMMEQHSFDKGNSILISEMFGVEGNCGYDNSDYLKALMKMLRIFFPKDEDGFCEIEQYCYVINFGKNGDEYESIEEFYDRLVKDRYSSLGLYDKEKMDEWRKEIYKI
jgi:hypothetical protein